MHSHSDPGKKADEWTMPVWTAAVGFNKAFDSISHMSMWDALLQQGTPLACVRVLADLYCGQTASVQTDKCSKTSNAERGTKQGDPLSSLLFNSTTEYIMRNILLQFGSERLTNPRCAGCIMLVAGSLGHITSMSSDLRIEAAKSGLLLRPDKTMFCVTFIGDHAGAGCRAMQWQMECRSRSYPPTSPRNI
eukprot:9468295-Pyramimonas_sp.AAC.1